MNKDVFLQELEKKLKKLPKEEKEAAITYYREYFADAGEQEEEVVIKEIGNPSTIASQIMANYVVKETNKKEENLKRSFSTSWIVILAILASPIALPLAVIIVALIFAAWLVIISFWITGVALVISGIIYIFFSVFSLLQDFSLGLFMSGCGMITLGFGIAVIVGSSNLFVYYSSWITKKISKFLLRKEKRDEK